MKSFLWILILLLFTVASFARSTYKVEGNSVIIELEGIAVKSKLLKIEVWSSNTVRISTTMNSQFSETPSIFGKLNAEPIKFSVAYAQANVELATSNIIVNIAEDGIVRLLTREGKKIMVESSRSFSPSEIEDGATKINQKFFLNRGEHIFGFGQNADLSKHNLRDKSFEVIQDNASIASPVFFSEKGFAFIWDNYSQTTVNDIPSGLSITSAIADDIQYFVINGPDWNTIISEIRKISGNVPMLPKWAFGHHLNPNLFSTQEALQSTLEKFQADDIPVETKVVDNSLYLKEKELTASAKNDRLKNAAAYFELKEKFSENQKGNTQTRTFIPTHINLPGIQKYGTFTIAGEVDQCWKSLQNQITSGINSSFSGQPYWSTTIGGVKTNNSCKAEPYDELLLRWYQFAAFTPIFQGGSIDKVNSAETKKLIAETIKLRYKLLPYIYSNAYSVSTAHKTLMQSLLYDYPKDEPVHDLDKQYLFGTSIMVCPISESGVKTIPILFPDNMNWVDFWTGKKYNGGSKTTLNVSLKNIPLFVKEGSIIPFCTVGNLNAENKNSPIEIRVYGGADAEFVLYEDESEGYGYQNGQFSTINFSYTEKNKTLTIGSADGDYPGKIMEHTFNVVLVSEEEGIGTGTSTKAEVILYKGKKTKVKFE